MSNTTKGSLITDAQVGVTPSLTTWLTAVIAADPARKLTISSFLQQDWQKIERLRALHEDMGVPIHDYLHLESASFDPDTEEVQAYFALHQHTTFAIRAHPSHVDGKLVRALGLTQQECLISLDNLRSNGQSYEIYLWDHLPPEWSGTILVTAQGLYAEMVQGSHLLLTQQFAEASEIVTARLAFPERHMIYSTNNIHARTMLWRAITALLPKDCKPFSPFSFPRFLKGSFEFSYHSASGYRFFDSNNHPFIARIPFAERFPALLE